MTLFCEQCDAERATIRAFCHSCNETTDSYSVEIPAWEHDIASASYIAEFFGREREATKTTSAWTRTSLMTSTARWDRMAFVARPAPSGAIGSALTMQGNLRCVEGRIFRHDPQWDDPDLETDVGQCPDCSGDGCGDDGEPVEKAGRSLAWLNSYDCDRS